MTYTQAISHIHSLRQVGMQMGLDRIQEACKRLSHPEAAYPAVHIAGTNGKGSTATMIAAILSASGYRVGLFTSPVLTTERDIIQINGQAVSEERFVACVERVHEAMPSGLSEYEFLTAVTFCCFEEEHIDIAVIECCLGGETDVTNVIPPPLCAVFTPIAIDHTSILGNTVEEIAKQKSGIAKAPADIVCAPHISEEAMAVLFEKAAVQGQTVYSVHPPLQIHTSLGNTTFHYRDHQVSLSLNGAHQADNATTALTVCEVLSKKGFAVSLETAITALAAVKMPCRLEYLPFTQPVILDGGHNPHGTAALCRMIDSYFDTPITLILGMLKDKDVETCVKQLATRCKQIICCTPYNSTRALDACTLETIVSPYCSNTRAINDPYEAFLYAQTISDAPIVIGGSFYTVAPIRERLLMLLKS